MTVNEANQDEKYLALIMKKINVCKAYTPKFGQGKSVSFNEFREIYGSDPFYSWFGLDNSLMYAAHKAAGGITSLYRQIGVGCEQMFRQIICDQLGLTEAQAIWSYKIKSSKGQDRTLSLDGRIDISDLKYDEHKEKLRRWIGEVADHIRMAPEIARALRGAVFEVRQGYKSKDSKRQNADIGNAGTAYSHGYLPVVTVLSTQIDNDVAERYMNAGWLLLRGHLSDSSVSSTYAFCKHVLDYDLAGFFQRNSGALKESMEEVLELLLRADANTEAVDVPVPKSIETVDELELASELESTDEN
jgi:hypothetical protein